MVFLFLANGLEEIEALTPVDVLRRAGMEVVTVGIGGKTICGTHGIPITADTDDAHLPSLLPEMVILPGGMPGAAHLDASPVVNTVLARASESGAFLAAICAAPMVLGHRGYLRGKRATCYPGFEDHLTGAQLVKGPCVVRDGKVITATGMGLALEFALTLVSALRDDTTARTLRASLMCRDGN